LIGILSEGSSNNIISGNTIKDNMNGIWLSGGSNNRIYHNNFIGLPSPCFFDHASMHTFDAGYPLGGNYWHVCYNNGYKGADLFSGLFQNETGSDGIGDTPHLMPYDNEDNYPLMGMFSSFNTSLGEQVNVISNSTIEDFTYFESNLTIRMHVSGQEGIGFCRVCFPKLLFCRDCLPYLTVIIDDGVTPVLYPNYTLYDNDTHRWIYFAYEHSIHKVEIIPEFPSFLILPLFMIATLLAVIVYRRKYTR